MLNDEFLSQISYIFIVLLFQVSVFGREPRRRPVLMNDDKIPLIT